jgi:hypothetical protein
MRIIGKQLVVALASAGLPRHEPGDGGGVAGVLLMTKRDHAQSRGLRHAGEVRDRDARQAEDGVDAVELEGVDDQVKPVGHRRRRSGGRGD